MPRYLRYIFSQSLKQKNQVIALGCLLVVGVLVRLAEPYFYKVIVDTLAASLGTGTFSPTQTNVLIICVSVWFVLAVILNLTAAQSFYLTWKIGNHSAQEVQMKGYQRLLRLDYAQHIGSHSSKLAKIIDDADVSMWEMTNWWLNRFISAFLGFAGMLIIALLVSWKMTLIAVAVIPYGLWFTIRHIKKYEDRQKEVNKLWERKHEHLSDQITNVVTYKLNPHENIFLGRHREYVENALAAQLDLNRKWRLVEMLNPDVFARFMVLAAGILFVKDGSITLGTLFMFMGLLNEILIPLRLLGDILPQYTRRTQHIERFLDLIEKPDAIAEPENPAKISKIKGDIAFDNISFSYGKTVQGFHLKNVSFEIPAGKTVALVGHSGSGKTTIMMLINRLVDPDTGTITIDGVDIKKYDSQEIKRHIGSVLQENAMYNETIAENIAYGQPDASRDEIIKAARQACADDFITRLPSGYDTTIGERGVRLSGGEKQRLAIARAILKKPEIVILDEPTSALDSMTEAKVQKGLSNLMKDKTTLVIAHRLSTVKDASMIIVLEKGKIIGQGTHAQLMKDCKRYKEMVDLQIKGFLADE